MKISPENINRLKNDFLKTENSFIADVLEKNDDATKNQIRKEMWRLIGSQNNLTIINNNEPQPARQEINIKALAEKFLSWPLPNSVCSDLCVTKPEPDQAMSTRIGTNLLTAVEAEQMLRYLFGM